MTASVPTPTRVKSSTHAPNTMPPSTRAVPGRAGNTVPARPATMSATLNIHSAMSAMPKNLKK